MVGRYVRGVRRRVWGLARPILEFDPVLQRSARSFRGAVVLEPGGPSWVLSAQGPMPVYRHVAAVDTLDFAERTIWSGDVAGAPIRRRLIGEAANLAGIDAASYDAVFASHVIEHVANPLGALREWKRVLRPHGRLLLIVPHRENTFDHRRPVTPLGHLVNDANRNIAEDDLTHLPEALALHDLSRDPLLPSVEAFEERSRNNLEMRALHHHVFDSRAVVRMCEAAGFGVMLLRPRRPHHIICVCAPDAASAPISRALKRSPFVADRQD